MATTGATLELQDGTTFSGEAFGDFSPTAGEVVFNTGMVGYPESLTDPSYCGQILVLTYPLVGNYGVPEGGEDHLGLPKNFESDRVQVAGLVVATLSRDHSHHAAVRSLHEWLAEEGVPGLTGVDTRHITKRLRARGVMPGRLVDDTGSVEFEDPNERDLASEVCGAEARVYNEGAGPRVAVIDAGVKTSILRSLALRGFEVVRVPYTADPMALEPAAVVAGNGPGDPEMYPQAVESMRVDSLPGEWDAWFTNANDGSCEGIRREDGLAWAVQFHPEATPGPTDTDFLFDRFADLVKGRR
jgi:carbamoyl-phosphate synthase small subunit